MKQVTDLHCVGVVKCCGECLGTVQSRTSMLSEETAGRKEQSSEHKVDLFTYISLLLLLALYGAFLLSHSVICVFTSVVNLDE